MSYVLCVDGGGSKCTAVLVRDDGTTLTGEAGPCNPSTIGLEATVHVICTAIQSALSQDGSHTDLSSITLSSAWIGVAGYDRPLLAPQINGAISRLLGLPLGPRLRITADIDLLAVNASQWTEARSAIVLVAGTGSVAMSYSREEDDNWTRSGRVGGWGPLLGDDGSGYSIGKDALRLALRVADGMLDGQTGETRMSPLCQAVFNDFSQEQPDFHPRDLLSALLTSTPTKNIARAARIVLSLDDDDKDTDGEARRILGKGAASLADLVVEIVKIKGLQPSRTALIMAGGLLCHSTYNSFVQEELQRRGVDFPWSRRVESPALEGARYLAGKHA